MKIAINECYGGFSLSPKAIQRIIKLQGRDCTFFSIGDEIISMEEASDRLYFQTISSTNKGKKIKKEYLNDIDRTNPLLIQVIEELGDEASGRFSKIKIIEIPDDMKYEIEDYDGMETVREYSKTFN